MLKRGGAVILVATIAALGAPALASAASPSKRATLHVAMNVDRVVASRNRTSAHGTVTAVLSEIGGQTTTLKQPVTLRLSAARGCKILHLELDQLTLVLLGLNVNLDKVTLDVTGQAHGGVLGSLFCKLSRTHVASAAARRSVAHSLNRALRRRRLRPLSFTVPLTPRVIAAQAPACQVLNLILGPLNLNLLGLVVDLQKVTLNVTATPGQGALGDLFCQLSH